MGGGGAGMPEPQGDDSQIRARLHRCGRTPHRANTPAGASPSAACSRLAIS
jgi:hypothetical protein